MQKFLVFEKLIDGFFVLFQVRILFGLLKGAFRLLRSFLPLLWVLHMW